MEIGEVMQLFAAEKAYKGATLIWSKADEPSKEDEKKTQQLDEQIEVWLTAQK
jgi:hypothetical protein